MFSEYEVILLAELTQIEFAERAPCHARLDNWRDTGVRLVAYPSAPIICGTYASVLQISLSHSPCRF